MLVILTPSVIVAFTPFYVAPRVALCRATARALGPLPYGASFCPRAAGTERALTMLRRRSLPFSVVLTWAVIRALARLS
jgi:hypothetical protein